MKVEPIANPNPGEHVVGVYPPPASSGVVNWHRRLNLYTGRSLTDVALQTEQQGRAGRLATAGQALSPGVITGLEAQLELNGNDPLIHLTAGAGLTAGGEDVFMPKNITVRLNDLPVYVTPELLARLNLAELRPEDNSLGNLIQMKPTLLDRAVLMVMPVTAPLIGNFDPEDPCEIDPQNDAFTDKRMADGCRLALYMYPWPFFLSSFNNILLNGRNREAYGVFQAELTHGPDEFFPWEEIGVPVGLLLSGLSVQNQPKTASLIDRYSVVRAGGRPKRRSMLVANSGNPFLWQARLQQFAEQIAQIDFSATTIPNVRARFAFLPPFGVLPKIAVNLVRRKESEIPPADPNGFFPPSFSVTPAPIAVEELDDVFAATASLMPLDMGATTSVGGATESVSLLVPVPQAVYDPRLLIVEEISEAFLAEVNRLVTVRGQWLQRRALVREKAGALFRGVTGDELNFPPSDPDALEADETVGTGTLSPPEDEYEVTGTGTTLAVTAFKKFWDENVKAAAPAFIRFELRKLELLKAKIYPAGPSLTQNDPAGEFADKLIGLDDFIDLLNRKIKYAEDRIDVSFARAQTDIYRVRQIVLGAEAATRLATSPTLAAIAQGQTAVATRDDITKFVETAKTQIVFEEAKGAAPKAGTKARTPGSAEAVAVQQQVQFSALAKDVHSAGRADKPVAAPKSGLSARISATTTRAEFGADKELAVSGVAARGGQSAVSAVLAGTVTGTVIGPTLPGLQIPTTPVATFDPNKAAILAETGNLLAVQPTRPPTTTDVSEQASIVGKPLDFRTVTVSDRIVQPAGPEAKDFSVSNKHDMLDTFLNPPDHSLALYLDDITIPGFYQYVDKTENGVKTRILDTELITYSAFDETAKKPVKIQRTRPVPKEDKSVTFQQVRSRGLLGEILQGMHDLDPLNGDESAFFGGGVRAVDHTVAILRLIEGRVKSYKTLVAACQDVLDKMRQSLDQVNARLQTIGNELAEARHDVSVARALMAEENARLDAVNKRRDEILNRHVTFLAFCRTREAAVVVDSPQRPLDPGLRPAPVPDCLNHEVSIPPELRRMVDFLREAPVRWLINLHPLLDRLDDFNSLALTMQSAQVRAQVQFPLKQASFAPPQGFYAAPLGKIFTAQQGVVAQARAQAAQLDLSTKLGGTWTQARDTVRDFAAVADLIETSHGRSDVARLSAAELDQIAHVAGCLYEQVNDVPARIRLLWAEQLSLFDAPVNLRNLGSLTRWGGPWAENQDDDARQVERLARRDMQTLVDWLYGRTDPRLTEAVGLINDLVRVCILLASHAPVKEIIAGHVTRPTVVKPNSVVELTVDPIRVKIGMEAVVYGKLNEVIARGVVEDLGAGKAAARIVQVAQANVSLEADARVQFNARKLLP